MQQLFPKRILISLYNTLILPHINYCLLSWGSSNATESIFLQQKKAIRAISSASHNAHTEALFKIFNILKLNDIFNYRLLTFYRVANSHAYCVILTHLTCYSRTHAIDKFTHAFKKITRILTQFYKIKNNLLFFIIVRLSVTLFCFLAAESFVVNFIELRLKYSIHQNAENCFIFLNFLMSAFPRFTI